MKVKCIKEFTDEYGFKYYVGKTYSVQDSNKEKNVWYYRYLPGAGPLGTLAICSIRADYFISIEEHRNNKIDLICS